MVWREVVLRQEIGSEDRLFYVCYDKSVIVCTLSDTYRLIGETVTVNVAAVRSSQFPGIRPGSALLGCWGYDRECGAAIDEPSLTGEIVDCVKELGAAGRDARNSGIYLRPAFPFPGKRFVSNMGQVSWQFRALSPNLS